VNAPAASRPESEFLKALMDISDREALRRALTCDLPTGRSVSAWVSPGLHSRPVATILRAAVRYRAMRRLADSADGVWLQDPLKGE
jgi:hypothetical protein